MTKESIEKTVTVTVTEEACIVTLANELKNILQASKKQAIIDKTSLFIVKAFEHCKKHGDTSLFKKVFFIKVDNTTLYNKLGIAKYLEDNNVMFLYNVKKDSLKVFGEWKDIKETFKEYKERVKKEMEKEKASLSKEQALENLFNSKIKNMSKEELELFKVFLKNN